MGQVVQFTARGGSRPSNHPGGGTRPSNHPGGGTGPVLWPKPVLVSPFGGSLEGATDAEVQAKALEMNPMRALNRLVCDVCDHQWQQPAATGNCPMCHNGPARLLQMIPCMAQRV